MSTERTRGTPTGDGAALNTDKARLVRVEFYRSEHGYGWSLTLVVRDKHRLRWCSREATTPMWPRLIPGGDENCNRALSLVLWPLGCLDIWWEPNWRPEGSGICDKCLVEFGFEPLTRPGQPTEPTTREHKPAEETL